MCDKILAEYDAATETHDLAPEFYWRTAQFQHQSLNGFAIKSAANYTQRKKGLSSTGYRRQHALLLSNGITLFVPSRVHVAASAFDGSRGATVNACSGTVLQVEKSVQDWLNYDVRFTETGLMA